MHGSFAVLVVCAAMCGSLAGGSYSRALAVDTEVSRELTRYPVGNGLIPDARISPHRGTARVYPTASMISLAVVLTEIIHYGYNTACIAALLHWCGGATPLSPGGRSIRKGARSDSGMRRHAGNLGSIIEAFIALPRCHLTFPITV